jgi:hypothetical protein
MASLIESSTQAMRSFVRNYDDRHPIAKGLLPSAVPKKRLEVRVDGNEREYLACIDQNDLSMHEWLSSVFWGSGSASVRKIMEFCKKHPEVIAEPEITQIFYRMIDSYAATHSTYKTDSSLLSYFEQFYNLQKLREPQERPQDAIVKPITTLAQHWHDLSGLSALMSATDRNNNTLIHDIIEKSQNDRQAAETIQNAFKSYQAAGKICEGDSEKVVHVIQKVLETINKQKLKTVLALAIDKGYAETARTLFLWLVKVTTPHALVALESSHQIAQFIPAHIVKYYSRTYSTEMGDEMGKLYEQVRSLAFSLDQVYSKETALGKLEALALQDKDKKTLLHKVFEFGDVDFIREQISQIKELMKQAEGQELQVKAALREALVARDHEGRLIWHTAFATYQTLELKVITPLLELAVEVFEDLYAEEILTRSTIADKNSKTAVQYLTASLASCSAVSQRITQLSKALYLHHLCRKAQADKLQTELLELERRSFNFDRQELYPEPVFETICLAIDSRGKTIAHHAFEQVSSDGVRFSEARIVLNMLQRYCLWTTKNEFIQKVWTVKDEAGNTCETILQKKDPSASVSRIVHWELPQLSFDNLPQQLKSYYGRKAGVS